MIPEIFQLTEQGRQFSPWGPLLGMLILFLGMNMRVEVRFQKEEQEEEEE